MKSLIGVFVIVVALVAAACSSGGETAESGAQVDNASSPVADYLGVDITSESPSEALVAEEDRQSRIAECMSDAGFDYIPFVPSTVGFIGPQDSLSEIEFASTYGFGITTQWFSQTDLGIEDDLVGYDDSLFGGDPFGADPNVAIVEALPASDRAEYEASLFGEGTETESVAASGLPGGCQGEVYSESFNTSVAVAQAFGADLVALEEQALNDPSVIEFGEEVASCVAENGLAYSATENLNQRWEPKLYEVEGLVGYPTDDYTAEEFDALGEDGQLEVLQAPLDIPDEARKKLAALQAEEIELAMIVHECGGSPSAFQKVFRRVATELEKQYIEDNKVRLDEFKQGN